MRLVPNQIGYEVLYDGVRIGEISELSFGLREAYYKGDKVYEGQTPVMRVEREDKKDRMLKKSCLYINRAKIDDEQSSYEIVEG